MELKKALAIGAVAACSLAFNGCAIVPTNGYVSSYGAPVYYSSGYVAPAYVAPAFPLFGPNLYIGPRLGPSYNWGSNRGWQPRHYAPPAPHWGGHHGGYRR